jgi:hypothetical protein
MILLSFTVSPFPFSELSRQFEADEIAQRRRRAILAAPDLHEPDKRYLPADASPIAGGCCEKGTSSAANVGWQVESAGVSCAIAKQAERVAVRKLRRRVIRIGAGGDETILYSAMSALGHSRPMRSKPREHVCPLLPGSGQVADRLGMSA